MKAGGGRGASMFILMKTWRNRSAPITPKIMQSIQPGKNEPSKLMDGAPRQPVRQIKFVPMAARQSILPEKYWRAVARHFPSLIEFMVRCSYFQIFVSAAADRDRRKRTPGLR